MELRRNLLLISALFLVVPFVPAQQPVAASLPSFEVSTIKPCDPTVRGQHSGFESRPGGRVFVGCASVKMLAYYAFSLPEERVTGGPDWDGTALYNVEAVPPDTSATRTAAQPPVGATPSAEQRLMLQSLLRDRFKLQSHIQTRDGEVYLLSAGDGKLQMHLQSEDADLRDSRGNIMPDGQAFGENVSMAFLRELLTRTLGLPVLDETGLAGKYDFDLPPADPDNKDVAFAAVSVMERLGLKLKRGKGPVQTLIIDHVERPTEN